MEKVSLFTPIKINTLELPNRIVMSPMFSNSATKDGFVTKNTIKHYVDRARSGGAYYDGAYKRKFCIYSSWEKTSNKQG